MVWTRLLPIERTSPAAAVLNGRIVMHGGIGSGAGRSDALLEFDGTKWHPRAPSRRPPTGTAGLARIGDRLVHVPGDRNRAFETWEWDGTDWTQRLPAHQPPPRDRYGMASFGDKVLLFGGTGPNGRLNDTWLWNGIDWTEVQTVNRPPAMQYIGLAEYAGKMVLLTGSFNDLQTWEFDGVDWQQKVTPTRPSQRYSVSLAGTTKGVVLFSGTPTNDTWLWDGSTWTVLQPVASPPWHAFHTLVTLDDEVYLVAGESPSGPGNIWRFDGTTWTRVYETFRVTSRFGAATLGSKAVVLTGTPAAPQTWEWDGSAWTRKLTAHSPSARFDPSMVSLGDKVLLFGGNDGSDRNDTWIYDGNDWTELTPTNKPSPRRGAALGAFGTGALLFGGRSQLNYLDDTWAWDGTNWSLKPKPLGATPSAREEAALGELGGKAVLFGGFSGNALADTWEWNGQQWTQMPGMYHLGLHTPFAPFKGALVLSTSGGDLWSYTATGWSWIPRSGDLPEHGVDRLVAVGDHLMAFHTDISRIDLVAPDGAACVLDSQCGSKFCTDGVCCTSACKGDCEACSVAAGAALDGLCTPAPATQSCRPSAGVCDAEEFCDGTSGVCPGDSRRHAGFECRGAQGACDLAETCDGKSVECPDDLVQSAGVSCRDAACADDVTVAAAAKCDGVASACPASETLACAANEVCEDAACTPVPEVDAGTPNDPPDAGVTDPPPSPELPATGCGCGASGGALGLLGPLAVACWLSGRMRTRKSARESLR